MAYYAVPLLIIGCGNCYTPMAQRAAAVLRRSANTLVPVVPTPLAQCQCPRTSRSHPIGAVPIPSYQSFPPLRRSANALVPVVRTPLAQRQYPRTSRTLNNIAGL